MTDITRLSEFKKRKEREAHLCVNAVCTGCGHKWTAVAPVGEYVFECPECHTMKGTAEGFVAAEHVMFTCTVCTCQLFGIPWRVQDTEPHIMCIQCGTEYTWGGICSP